MIPLEVLEKWSKRGKDELSKQTYGLIQDIISEAIGDVTVCLQGSYANHTNVRDNSDIDVLVLCDGYVDDHSYYPNNIRNLKHDLFSDICGKKGIFFQNSSKTIKMQNVPNCVDADIVPCIPSNNGIKIYDSSTGKVIQNYPWDHKENGFEKNKSTSGVYKASVRMFKNARNFMVERGLLYTDSVVPSYFLECLLYNVPDDCYQGNHSQVYCNVINWLNKNRASFKDMYCQNEINKIFGTGSIHWNLNNAFIFINCACKIWDNWGRY